MILCYRSQKAKTGFFLADLSQWVMGRVSSMFIGTHIKLKLTSFMEYITCHPTVEKLLPLVTTMIVCFWWGLSALNGSNKDPECYFNVKSLLKSNDKTVRGKKWVHRAAKGKPSSLRKGWGKSLLVSFPFLTSHHRKEENKGIFLQNHFNVILWTWPPGLANMENLKDDRRPFEFSSTQPSRF